jgi:protein-tyrosine phosphatase
MKTVLFICKGNVFRSMTAEYALRRELGDRADMRIASAGTADFPYPVWPEVSDYLAKQGLDVSGHRRRTLTRAMLDEADLPIAMDPAPQAEVRAVFGVTVPLFLRVCEPHGTASTLPDIEEAIPNFKADPAATLRHIHATIDRIIAATRPLAVRLHNRPTDLKTLVAHPK